MWKFYVVPPRGNLTVPQMKKSCVRVGSGVAVERSTPDNREKKYFKWTMETRLLLLRECRDKEVWSITHGQTVRVWADIATILRNIPTYEETFVRLTWRKCQEEFDRNLAVYTTEKEGVPFRSGSDEQHSEWHDIMDEISTLTAEAKENDVELVFQDETQEKKTTEQDLKVVGEIFRNGQLEQYRGRKKTSTPKRATSTSKRKGEDTIICSDSSDEDIPPKKLTPTDQLALAVAEKLKADTARETAALQAPAAQEPTVPTFKYLLSQFRSIEDILDVAGITNPAQVEEYKAALVDFGFETPDLMMGLRFNRDLFNAMKFRVGHAIKLASILADIYIDV